MKNLAATHLNSAELDFLDIEPLEPDSRQRFLALNVMADETVLLPVSAVSKVLSIQVADVLPVPDMPPYICGILAWQGQMLWLADFAKVIKPDLKRYSTPQDTYAVVILTYRQKKIGITVAHVNDIELHDPEQIKAIEAGLFMPRLVPFSQGYMPSTGIAVLDAGLIIESDMLNGHSI